MSGNELEIMNCNKCNGTGYVYDECDLCGRDGWIDDPDGGTMTCPECSGDAETMCNACDGDGVIDEDDTCKP